MTNYNLILETNENGCITPISHKLNSDGYFRKSINGSAIMYHRHIWQEKFGNIPEGYEINHKCKNRACCNIDHLEVLDRTSHLIETNSNRYKERYETAKKYWNDTRCKGVELADIFGVSFGTGCKWIRKWKV